MRYFVVAEDGSKYGPADVKLLNAWVAEGRLLPVMTLEEEGSHHQVTAASVEALDFYVLQQPKDAAAPSPPPGEVIALDEPISQDPERLDMAVGWSMILITLCLIPFPSTVGFLGLFTALLGLVASMKAKDRNYPAATALLAFNALALIIWSIARLYYAVR
jgi:hypothetical protein